MSSSSDSSSSSSSPAASTPYPPSFPPHSLTPEQLSDEYKETWFQQWTNTTNPNKVNCRIAMDIYFYCIGPSNQIRHIYRTGISSTCKQQWEDLKLCVQIKANRDVEEGRKLLRENRESKLVKQPHIWNFRTQPPEQFRNNKLNNNHNNQGENSLNQIAVPDSR